MDVMTKTGRFEATLKSTSAITKAPTGSFEAILSVPTKDRDGEVVDAGAFNPLPDHITIDIDHAMGVEKTVASGRPFYDGEQLKFEGTYASHPLAQMVRSLVDEGHIRTMSVAYMAPVYEIDAKDGLPHLRSADLINAGIVGIPANREALITASKSLRLGAAADAGAGPERVRKSVVGSFEDRAERVRSAVSAAYPEADYVWMRATFDDSAVFELELSGMTSTFKSDYSVAEDGSITLGDAAKVELAEVVISPKSFVTDPETKTAAAAQAAAAVKSPAEVDVAKARATASMALARLTLIPS